MHEGYSGDDIWMMVEDEFYSTAQMFTQHIHHAAYVELKKKAKARGRDTLQSIARPTDGRTKQNSALLLKKEREEKEEQIKRGLGNDAPGSGSDDEAEDEYMHDPLLSGLMAGSQRIEQQLTGLGKVQAKTRAAAGFSKSPKKAERTYNAEAESVPRKSRKPSVERPASPMLSASSDEDDEDLDAKPAGPKKAVRKAPLSSSTKSERPKTDGFFKRFGDPQQGCSRLSEVRGPLTSRDSAERNKTIKQPVPCKASSPTAALQEEASQVQGRNQRTNDFLARRRAAKEKAEREVKEKAKNEVAIATFAL